MQYEERIRSSPKIFNLRHLKIAAVACLCVIITAVSALGIFNNTNNYVSFNELDAIGYVEGSPGLSGVLSPYPSDAVNRKLKSEQLMMLLHKDAKDSVILR